jgi:uncharacterized membrane protein
MVLDWMRGLGALIMLQGHVLDAWVRPVDRSSEWFWLSQFLGGLPAPIFLFLVGVSLAIVLDRMRTKGASSRQLAGKVLRRGAWILLLAYAFRIEQFLVWYPASRWSDVFKVDTLNCIAVCTLVIGLASVAFKSRKGNIIAMGLGTIAFVFLNPWIYPLRGLPAFILTYINGHGHPWYFSFFPWAAFTLAGITFGYILQDAKERVGERDFFQRTAAAGVGAYAIGVGMGLTRIFEYGFFDYSLTSPHFFFVRLGWILLILYGAYWWCGRKRPGAWSALAVLGQASLAVYWIHIEIVYGRFGFGQTLTLPDAALHLLWMVPLMLVVASAGTLSQRLRPLTDRAYSCASKAAASVTGCLQAKFSQIYAVGCAFTMGRSRSNATLGSGPAATTVRGVYRLRKAGKNDSGEPISAISLEGPT